MVKVQKLKDAVIEESKGLEEAILADGIVPTHRILYNVEKFLNATRKLRQELIRIGRER